jgi:integrase
VAREALDGGRVVTGQYGQLFKTDAGSWGYRYRSADGKRPQKSGYRTKGEARNALDEQLRRQRLGGLYRPRTTVGEIVEEFFAIYHADARTISWMRYHADKVTAAFADEHPDEIDASAIGRWRRTLPNEASAHQTLRVFRQILGQAVKWGWIERNPATLVPNPQPRKAEVAFFATWPEVEAVALELGDGADGGVIAIVGAGTGLRPEEMFGLDWPDVDLMRRIITVRRVFTKGKLKPYGKTDGSLRRVPLRARVVDALQALDSPHRGAVFHGDRGARIHLDNWRKRAWKPALESAGMDYLIPYALRHTYAAWSLAASINIFTLARRMGTSVAMIERTYGHLAHDADDYERSLLDAWDAVGGALDSDPSGRGLDISRSRAGE